VIIGLTENCLRGNGKKERTMDWEKLHSLVVKPEKENGRMDQELDG